MGGETGGFRCRCLARWACRALSAMLLAGLIWSASVPAADAPAPRDISQWHHTAWTFAGGAPGQVSMLHQSSDGFLWLGAAQSLYRFDGVKFERFVPDDGQPITFSFEITDTPDGGMWIGLAAGGIVYLHGRHVVRYGPEQGAPSATVQQIVVGSDGRVWAASPRGLYFLQGQRWEKAGPAQGFPGSSASRLLLDRSGALWVAAKTLLRMPRGATSFVDTGIKVAFVYDMVQAPDGLIWAGQPNRVGPVAMADGTAYTGDVHYAWDSAGMVFDRDGTLWLSTLGNGLKRLRLDAHGSVIPDAMVDTYTASEGLSADYAWPILQDREGNVWVGTSAGLDRFRQGALLPQPFPPGSHDFALAADGRGGIIAGTTNHPPMLLADGQVTTLLPENAKPDAPVRAAYRDERGRVWLGSDAGLWIWEGGHLTQVAALPPVAGKSEQVQAITSDYDGGVWVALLYQGLWHWRDDQWTHLSDKAPTAILSSPDGTLLALSHVLQHYEKDVLVRSIDLSALQVVQTTVLGAGNGHTWVGSAMYWGVYDGKAVRRIRSKGDQVWGIGAFMETPQGDLWIDAVPGIFHVPAAEVKRVLAQPDAVLNDFVSYDYLDGLPGRPSMIRPIPGAVRADDGTLWFSTSNGVASIDPAHLPHNPLPPPISITAARIDNTNVDIDHALSVPPGATNLEVHYTALSLTMPERVAFQYKLEGWDKDWQDVGNRRTAYYSDLSPGQYRFVVRASNNDGVWNNDGASLGIAVRPAFYQTWWFRLLCIVAVVLLLGLALRARLLYMERSVRERLEVQHAERDRIAREIHDTLLQGVQGLALRIQSVANQIPREQQARHALEGELDRVDMVVSEARKRVLDLRTHTTEHLQEALAQVAGILAVNSTMDFRVLVEGRPRALRSGVHTEVLSIAKEAMFNAFLHSKGSLLEVEIAYLGNALRLRVRDNGVGMTEQLLQSGRPNHWGLGGMRERAEEISAKIHIWSREGEGCEIELTVPGSVAFAAREQLWRRWLARIHVSTMGA
ncbi:sensor histidine kinase [Dyella terrae]|uniref:sensor histidine kinase n=1 Tax=Dyella terrae TaxID=522259 RepID=UPI001EFCCFDA|nr:sensor histidine kinase [Dyella terrae]ULU25832.1 sensor histidine kinase [Dyella terrae]